MSTTTEQQDRLNTAYCRALWDVQRTADVLAKNSSDARRAQAAKAAVESLNAYLAELER